MFDKEEVEPEYVKCLRIIVQTDDKDVVKEMIDKLEEMENCESGSKSSMYGLNSHYDQNLRSILNMTNIKNVQNIRFVLEWFSKFPFPENSPIPISDDIAHFMTNCVKDFKNESDLIDIIQVLTENQSKYLPQQNNHTNLCKAIIEVLSWIPVDKNVESKTFESIYRFLKALYSNNQRHIAFDCCSKLCEIFLKEQRDEPISSYVIMGLYIIEKELWKQHMNVAVEKIVNQTVEERKIINMLNIMCQWTVEHHHIMEYLSMWLSLFIDELAKNNNKRIPKELAELALPEIFDKYLRMEQFDSIDFCFNIVLQLVHQIGSQNLYHSMLEKLCTFISTPNWKEHSKKHSKKLCCTIQFFNMISTRFREHLKKPCSICGNFEKKCNMVLNEINPSSSSNIPEESEEMEISYHSTSNINIGRMDTRKVGLINLGNTCYMNSVLQALAMTTQFCHEVSVYKTIDDTTEQTVLKNLQNLFRKLNYLPESSFNPKEILQVSRPSYFMPGQQQDSSEFLCHLLDVMYEQEKFEFLQRRNNDQTILKAKSEDKEMVVEEEDSPSLNSPLNDEGKSNNMTRWTTEENLSEGASLQRKTQSLADFTQGEELAQTQNVLSDSHSDSTDSGIQSVGGEDSSSSSSTSSPAGTGEPTASYLVHRVFGGELKVSYQCSQCNNESHNTDRFRDLQLCFFENLDHSEAVTVQNLLNLNYFMPEKLTGDNKYRCDKCKCLCDAQRSIKIVQAPAHLILTLKHFRYDSESRLRTKLSRKVIYDETIKLPVLDQDNETYQLYAAVVHSGYSLDYGHYITYASDSKNRWYLFNDSHVSQTTIERFKGLEPPDTPYILFYKRCTDEVDDEDAEFTMSNKRPQDNFDSGRRKFTDDRENRQVQNGSKHGVY